MNISDYSQVSHNNRLMNRHRHASDRLVVVLRFWIKSGKMEAAEVSGQINAMVEFIKKEAQDKVEELEEKTRQDVIKLKV